MPFVQDNRYFFFKYDFSKLNPSNVRFLFDGERILES